MDLWVRVEAAGLVIESEVRLRFLRLKQQQQKITIKGEVHWGKISYLKHKNICFEPAKCLRLQSRLPVKSDPYILLI